VQRYAKHPRVNYLETVSAKTAVEAAYIKAWIDKVERVGNSNYPDYARRRNLSARLILHVLPASDGSTVNAFISAFSEQKVLDNAALHIVKLAAPFKPFSTQMRKAYDQVMITRTGVFKSEGGLTTQ
jgi:protein TonB